MKNIQAGFKPRITVVMAVFNGERFLAEAVECVLNQTYTNFQLLVINDGSTDRTTEILQNYMSDSRVIVVNEMENKGLAHVRNQALGLVGTELLAWTDSDDRSLPNWLQAQLDYLDAHAEVDVVGCWMRYIDESGEIIPNKIWKTRAEHGAIAAEMLIGSPIPSTAVMLRVDSIKSISYNEKVVAAEDYAYWVSLLPVCHFANIQDFLVEYRQHTGQVSSSKRSIQIMDHLGVYAQQFDALKISYTQSDLVRHATLFGFQNESYLTEKTGDRLDMQYLMWARSWLMNLAMANHSLAIYPKKNFEWLLGKRWKSTCRKSAKAIGWGPALKMTFSFPCGAWVFRYLFKQ